MTLLSWGRSSFRRARSESGVTSLEMAILFPVILFIIMSMFQISLYWHTANTVGAAADMGLDAGQVFPDDHGRAVSEAQTAAGWLLSTSSARNASAVAQVIIDPVTGAERLQVTVVADSPQIVGIANFQVRSVAEGRMEDFVPADQR